MRAEAHQFEGAVVGLAIDQDQVWPDMAVAMVDPVVAIERMLIKSLDPEWNLQHTKTGQPKRGTYWSN